MTVTTDKVLNPARKMAKGNLCISTSVNNQVQHLKGPLLDCSNLHICQISRDTNPSKHCRTKSFTERFFPFFLFRSAYIGGSKTYHSYLLEVQAWWNKSGNCPHHTILRCHLQPSHQVSQRLNTPTAFAAPYE